MSGLSPSSGILSNQERNVSEIGSVSGFRLGEGDIYSVGSLSKRTVNEVHRASLSECSTPPSEPFELQ
jgi:hypothetical protein